MNFNNDKAIYIQIADRLCDEILAGTYQDDERIPSVREYAVTRLSCAHRPFARARYSNGAPAR